MSSTLLSYAFNLFTQIQSGVNTVNSLIIPPITLNAQQLTNAKEFSFALQMSPAEVNTVDLKTLDISLVRVLLIRVEEGLPVTISLQGETTTPSSIYFKDFAVNTLPPAPVTTLPLVITNTSSKLVTVRVVGVGY